VNITVVPITVDTDEVAVVKREAEPRHILHIGTMYWPPNVDAIEWFVHHVYPLIRQQRPDVQFDVVVPAHRPPCSPSTRPHWAPRDRLCWKTSRRTSSRRRWWWCLCELVGACGSRFSMPGRWVTDCLHQLGCEGIQVADGEDILIATTGRLCGAVLRCGMTLTGTTAGAGRTAPAETRTTIGGRVLHWTRCTTTSEDSGVPNLFGYSQTK